MCGIVGIAGNLFAREEQTMKKLLLLDSLRGMDSTGMAGVRIGGHNVLVAKKATHCFNLWDTKSFCDALNGTASIAFIGHNRSATVGGIKDVNAHPFQIDHITGVHNGTLEDRDKKMLEDLLNERFNTDSEALFAAIAKFGVSEVIPKVSKGRDSLKGAWSLVWWDANEKTLNFLRNAHRPLWYCFSKDFKQVFWASEFWMLDAALQKSGNYDLYQKQSKDSPDKKFRFFQTKEDIWYSVDVSKLAKGSKDRPDFKAVKLAGKEPEAATETSYPFVQKPSDTHGTGCGRTTAIVWTPTQKSISSDKHGAITWRGDVNNPYAGYFSRMGFSFLGNTRTSGDEPQCSWCHKGIPYGQTGLYIVTRDNIIICSSCNGNEPVSALSDYAPATRVLLPRAAFSELK